MRLTLTLFLGFGFICAGCSGDLGVIAGMIFNSAKWFTPSGWIALAVFSLFGSSGIIVAIGGYAVHLLAKIEKLDNQQRS